MGKAQPKKRSPVVYLGAVAAVVVAYILMTGGDDSPHATATKSSTAKKKSLDTIYTDDDYKATPASFAPIKGALVDAFKPLVFRSTGGGESMKGGIPGAEGWNYAGMATVDGVKKAVLENNATGDCDFLTAGEHWLTYSIVSIYPDHVALNGPDGPLTVTATSKESSGPVTPSTDANVAPPVQVPLQGNIGNPDLSVLPDTTDSTPRRRRRNAN